MGDKLGCKTHFKNGGFSTSRKVWIESSQCSEPAPRREGADASPGKSETRRPERGLRDPGRKRRGRDGVLRLKLWKENT